MKEKAGLPQYYYENNWLEEKIDQIRKATRILHGISFVFITDIHVSANSMYSKYLIKEVLDRTTVKDVFFGGDAVCAYGTERECLEQAEAMVEYANYVSDRFFTVHGNHDFTIRTGPGEATGFTAQWGTVYDFVMRQRENIVNGVPGKCFYYLDNPAQKVRFLVLDAYEHMAKENQPWGVTDYVSQEQYDWLVEDALNVQRHTIVVFAHPSCDKGVADCSEKMIPIADMLRALNRRRHYSYHQDEISVEADFKETTSVVAAYICGHNHGDYHHAEDGLLTISTTCDASYNDDPNCRRTRGDITEQAFDVFTIDIDEKRISTVRIGAGVNRSWKY